MNPVSKEISRLGHRNSFVALANGGVDKWENTAKITGSLAKIKPPTMQQRAAVFHGVMKWLINRFERSGILDLNVSNASNIENPSSSPRMIDREWFWDIVLLSPFLIATLWRLFSGRDYNVFWGEDETEFHYPLVLQLVRQWPHFDLVNIPSATTPLLHLIGAVLVRFFGANLEGLRLFNTVVSALGVLYVSRFLRYSRGWSPCSSALGAAVLMLSFYFFGYSFRFVTDNLALVLCLFAMGSLYRFLTRPDDGLSAYLMGCVWLSLALFTRQSCVFLCAAYGICLLQKRGISLQRRSIALAALGVALVPTLVMFALWKGVVPPPCAQRCTPGTLPFYPHSVAMPFSILGFYVLFFRAADIISWARGGWRKWSRRRTITVVVAVALGLVCSFFLTGVNGFYSGVLNTVARDFPQLAGIRILTSLLLFIGLSAVFLTLIQNQWFAIDDPGKTIGILCFLAICAFSVANNVAAQKYYDAQVLACLLWSISPSQAESRRWKFAMWILIGVFCIYQVARQSAIWYMS